MPVSNVKNSRGRKSITLRPLNKAISPAVALLGYRNANAPVTLLLTTRCDLTCAHCFSTKPEKPKDLDQDLARETITELRGLERLYFSGGEPFLYLAGSKKHEQIFMDLVCQAAEKAGRLCIDTNGMFLPPELKSATSYLQQFPGNTTFVISADKFHAAAIEKRGRSLKQMIGILAGACEANGLGLEFNSRQIGLKFNKTGAVRKLRREFGIAPARQIYLNSVSAQGEARKLEGARPVSWEDFIRHAVIDIQSIGLFVTPKGSVVSGDHLAYLESPPEFSVLGDLNRSTLARVLWDSLKGLASYHTHGTNIIHWGHLEYLKEVFHAKDAKKMMEQLLPEGVWLSRAVELEKAFPPLNQPISWEYKGDVVEEKWIFGRLSTRLEPILKKTGLSRAERAKRFELIDGSFGKALEKGMADGFKFFARSLPAFFENCPREILIDHDKLKLFLDLGGELTQKGGSAVYLFGMVFPGFFENCPKRILKDDANLRSIFALAGEAGRRGESMPDHFMALSAFFKSCPRGILEDQAKLRSIFDLGGEMTGEKMSAENFYKHFLPTLFRYYREKMSQDGADLKYFLDLGRKAAGEGKYIDWWFESALQDSLDRMEHAEYYSAREEHLRRHHESWQQYLEQKHRARF